MSSERLIVVAKRDCPTCVMLEGVYGELRAGGTPLAVYTQDDPAFPDSIPVRLILEGTIR